MRGFFTEIYNLFNFFQSNQLGDSDNNGIRVHFFMFVMSKYSAGTRCSKITCQISFSCQKL